MDLPDRERIIYCLGRKWSFFLTKSWLILNIYKQLKDNLRSIVANQSQAREWQLSVQTRHAQTYRECLLLEIGHFRRIRVMTGMPQE